MLKRISSKNIQELYSYNEETNAYSFQSEYFVKTVLPSLPKKAIRKSHVLQCSDFSTVFATSDIHADFRKFIQILKDNAFLQTPLDPYTDDIYHPDLIGQAKWTGPPNTLFVVIGDLVDGRRNHGSLENGPDDPRGSFEFLLLAFLYNLRLSAIESKSEILFTIGNHDASSVIRKASCEWFYSMFVTKQARAFFGSYATRRQALFPFYSICPYYMIALHNGLEKEVAFVHGSLHSDNESYRFTNFTEALERFQISVDEGGKIDDFFRDEYLPNPNPCDRYGAGQTALGPLWSRLYSESPTGVCDKIQDTGYKTIVVGHCPTSLQEGTNARFQTLLAEQPVKYANCDAGHGLDDVGLTGCVMMDCESDRTKLLFVDVGMSKGQRTPTQEINNADRKVQILRLLHDPTGDASLYYNRMDGLRTDGHIVLLYGKNSLNRLSGGKHRPKSLRRQRILRKRTRKYRNRSS